MGTGGWSTGWWLLLGPLRITIPVHGNCISLEFDGLKSSDKWIEIKENSYINLIAHLKWPPGCERNAEDKIQLKITYKEGLFAVDLCKLLLTTDCYDSDSSNATSMCRCLNKGSVQFYKKVSKSDSKNYTWTWAIISQNPVTEKRKGIFISVTAMATEERTNTPLIAASTCAFVVVVVVAAVGYSLWKRTVVSCCQEYSSSPPGVDAGCRDNDEETRQVDDSVYADIKDACYSDIQDDDLSHLDDPSYVYIKEEMNCPGQPRYVYIRKQGKSQARDSTYLHRRVPSEQEGTGQQEDLTYENLRALN